MTDHWNKRFEQDFESIYVVYFTMYNGDVKVIKKEKNIHPEFAFEVEGISFVSQPIILVQTDNKNSRAFVYICAFPESEIGISKFFSFSEKDRLEFRRFLENIKPSDFKKFEQEE